MVASAFVLSSRSEGFGNVLVEAMGCGTRVVSTSCPHGPADILGHGRYGVLVPQQDPTALASGLEQVLDQRVRWPAPLLRARAAEFSYEACSELYLQLFRQLMGQGGQAAQSGSCAGRAKIGG